MLLSLASMELNPQLILAPAAFDHCCALPSHGSAEESLQKRYRLLALLDCPAPMVQAEAWQQFLQQQASTIHVLTSVTQVSAAEWQAQLDHFHQVLRF